MVRVFIFIILLSTTVLANNIYMEQSSDHTAPEKAALQTENNSESTYQQPESGSNFEKSLIVPTDTQYCSVVAGCYTQE